MDPSTQKNGSVYSDLAQTVEKVVPIPCTLGPTTRYNCTENIHGIGSKIGSGILPVGKIYGVRLLEEEDKDP